MLKVLTCILLFATLTGCGEYGDKMDAELVQQYKDNCASQGFKNVKITFMFGRPSAYYSCF
ncbi:hypothetical protein IttPL_0054 [Pseudomonas phage ITTPL]|uniref:Lipoprotein n=1 Tax=Pseudomonas phage ITTPL TaxID=2544984 RepID=A0A5B7LVH7_9CAUD|nr:hypothetical protein QE324_gp053 [Pseudomonas phage ITTPL]QBP28068.1 hypothetical protein IttPL_0054 [Pseudomonas phage ITTPL]